MLNENLPVPLISLDTDTNGWSIFLQLPQKLGGIKVIVDIDFHAILLVDLQVLVRLDSFFSAPLSIVARPSPGFRRCFILIGLIGLMAILMPRSIPQLFVTSPSDNLAK